MLPVSTLPESAVVSFASSAGVDLHKCTVSLDAVDPLGKSIARLTCSTKCVEKIDAFLAVLPRPSHLAVEAVGFVEWFIDRFRGSVDRIEIADATRLSDLRGKRRKTDRNDAHDIAVRLARGDCPLGFVAPEEVMQLRKLGRHWRCLSRSLSRAKHSMSSILLAANLKGPTLDGAGAQRWLLAHGHLLKDAQRDAFGDFVDLIELLERKRGVLKRKIIQANGSERFDGLITILRSVPGIDHIWACIIASEIGDFARFPNADALEFWAGMTPDNLTSAGRTTSGHITKAGNATLRWALCKAGVTLCRSDAKQEAIRQRLIAKIGKPRANVAMGRRLLRILYAMVRDGSLYQGQVKTGHEAKANIVRLKKIQRVKEGQMQTV